MSVTRSRILTAVALAIVWAAPAAWAGESAPEQSEAASPLAGMFVEPALTLVGKPAPQFSLELLEGGEMSLKQHKDKQVVVIDFFATWCPPCRAAMPILVSVIDEYTKKDKEAEREPRIAFYAVSLGDAPEAIRQFQEQLGIEFPVALDKQLVAARHYKVSPIPHKVLIGKDGTVEAVHLGLPRVPARTVEVLLAAYEKQLRQELDTLLAGESLAKSKGE